MICRTRNAGDIGAAADFKSWRIDTVTGIICCTAESRHPAGINCEGVVYVQSHAVALTALAADGGQRAGAIGVPVLNRQRAVTANSYAIIAPCPACNGAVAVEHDRGISRQVCAVASAAAVRAPDIGVGEGQRTRAGVFTISSRDIRPRPAVAGDTGGDHVAVKIVIFPDVCFTNIIFCLRARRRGQTQRRQQAQHHAHRQNQTQNFLFHTASLSFFLFAGFRQMLSLLWVSKFSRKSDHRQNQHSRITATPGLPSGAKSGQASPSPTTGRPSGA